ncbi:MAG TPA: nucleotidyltransferase domain-containing protein [Thermoanaerobaculia bacterium]|nr:nucleotidyltransferase domain-containing protein [Thermoanaerobaculia bacterium]
MRRSENGTPIDVQPYLQDLRSYLESVEGLVAAWIFGSYGTPYQTPLSDLDLALLFRRDRVPDLDGQGQLYADIPEILHEEDVSIIILNRAPVLFQFRILETGRPLLCRDPIALADFTEEVISRHADFIVDYEQFVKDYDQALRERYIHDR